MGLLLVQPVKAPSSLGGEDVFLFEPLALEYIAAGVLKAHDVMILNLRLEKNLQDVLEGFRPQIVGITSYTVHVNPVKRLYGKSRRNINYNSFFSTLFFHSLNL